MWSGDTTSACAYSNVKGKFDVSYFLTFLHKEHFDPNFLTRIKQQSERLGVPFFWAKIKNSDLEGYRETIAELKEEYGVEGIITNGEQNLIEDACKASGMKMIQA